MSRPATPARPFRPTLALPAALLVLGACADDVSSIAAPLPHAALASAGAAVAHWAPMPGAQDASGFAVAADGRLLAVSETQGLLVADAVAPRWHVVPGLDPAVVPQALVASPDGALYAGTATGVLRSHDGGTSWVPTRFEERPVRRLAVTANGTLFAGAYGMGGGISRSTDGGMHWTMVYGPLEGRGGIIDWVRARKNDVLLGLYAQLPLYSRDAGDTWEPLWALFELPEWNAYANDMLLTEGGALLAAWAQGAARSDDGGASFRHVIADRQIIRFAADTARGAIYALASDGSVLRSTDDGRSWSEHAAAFRPGYVEAFGVTPAGGLVLGTWQGVWKSVP